MEPTRHVMKIVLCLSIVVGITIPTPAAACLSWFWPTPALGISAAIPLSTFERMCKPLVDPISICGVKVAPALLIAGGALIFNGVMLYKFWRAKQNARALAAANQQKNTELTTLREQLDAAQRQPTQPNGISAEEHQRQLQEQDAQIRQLQEQIRSLGEVQKRIAEERAALEQQAQQAGEQYGTENAQLQARINQLDAQNRELQEQLATARTALEHNQTLMREQTTQLNQLQADHKRIYQEHAQVYATLGQLQEERARIHGLFETIYNAISPLRTTLVNCPHVVCQKLNREWPGQSISQLASILLGLERTRTPSPASNGNGNRNNGHALLPATPRRPAATNNSHNGNRRTAVQTAGRGNAGKGNQAVHPPIRAHT